MDYNVDVVYQAPQYAEDMFVSTAKYPLDYNLYSVVRTIRCPFGHDFNYIIVKAEYTSKRNVYGSYNEFIAYNLVKYYKPLALKDAQIIFPNENFTSENYGFEKILVPSDIPQNK